MGLAMVTFGIEEEVFITEPERPTMRSLYYLARLFWKNPRFYYIHSASNLDPDRKFRRGWAGGLEINTITSCDVEALCDDLERRRADLASVCSGLMVPVGHLLDYDAPHNTCALHVHIGGDIDRNRLYRNLLHFLPVLPLFTINSPMVGRRYFGQSYRIFKSSYIGKIGPDWTARRQDVILSKRLGTIELRVCDPCWDMARVRWLVRSVKAIAELEEALEPNIERYNGLREEISRKGLLDETRDLAGELQATVGFPMGILERTASDELKEMYERKGLTGAYSALDNGCRNGRFEPREINRKQCSEVLHLPAAAAGFALYVVPRLEYYIRKWRAEK
jgi:hypothetical protein